MYALDEWMHWYEMKAGHSVRDKLDSSEFSWKIFSQVLMCNLHSINKGAKANRRSPANARKRDLDKTAKIFPQKSWKNNWRAVD